MVSAFQRLADEFERYRSIDCSHGVIRIMLTTENLRFGCPKLYSEFSEYTFTGKPQKLSTFTLEGTHKSAGRN